MKIRHPLLINLASRLGTRIIRTLCGSMRYESRFIHENYLPDNPCLPGRVIYVFWHDSMLMPAYFYGRKDIYTLVSPHADGQWLAGMLERLGFSVVRGSSNHKGTEALRQMLRVARSSHIAISPDGPRGPRRKLKDGPIYLASRSGLPIVPMGFACNKAWHAGSWDCLAIPKLFARGFGVSAPPIAIPPGVSKDTLEPFRQQVEESLHAVSQIAERWATTGLYDTYDYDVLPRTQPQSASLAFSSR